MYFLHTKVFIANQHCTDRSCRSLSAFDLANVIHYLVSLVIAASDDLSSISGSMRDSANSRRHIYLSKRLERVWKRVQQLHRGIKHPFCKIEQSSIEILPSPFKWSYNRPYETDPNEPVLSTTYLQTKANMSYAIPHTIKHLSGPTMDGAGEKTSASNQPHPVAAIFVHVGAGYHSSTNEHIHLDACRE